MEDIKEAQYTIIRCHITKFSRPADMASRICTCPLWGILGRHWGKPWKRACRRCGYLCNQKV